MKLLLTGPSGFVGSTFARLALSRGHEIAGLLIPTEPVPKHLPSRPALHWLRGTLEAPPWAAIKQFEPDLCVHAAWITTPGVYLESPENERFRDSSLKFMRQLTADGLKYVISLGTCIEYQIMNRPLREDGPLAPTTIYARCKNELRLALEADANSKGFGFCWARIFYPYGPGEHPSRLCSSIINRLLRDEKIVLKTPDSTKDYIFIDDLAEALITIAERRFEGTINIGTGKGVSVKRIAAIIADAMEKPGLIQQQEPPEADPAGYVVADASKLYGLGWTPRHTLEAGLRKMLALARSPSAG